jgi:parvulin-like peptidyl-prolyl isomerase
MGVIEGMRSGVDTPWMKFVFFVIIVTFVFWGSNNQGASSQVVAEVNGKRITDTEFNRRMRQSSRRLGAASSDAELARLQRQIMGALVEETVMLQEANRLGIEVSDREIADQLKSYTSVYGTIVRVPFTAFLDDFSTATARSEAFARQILDEWSAEGIMPTDTLDAKGIKPLGPFNLGIDQTRYEVFGLGPEILEKVMKAPGGITLYEMSTASGEPVIAELHVRSYRDDDGLFSVDLYESNLQSAGLTRPKYEQGLRRELTIQKLLSFASLAVTVHPHQVEARYREENTQLGLDWIRVTADAVADDVVVSQEDIEAMVAMDRPRLEALYTEQLDLRFRTPRQATFSTLLLRTNIDGNTEAEVEARLQDLRQQALDGADFADLARMWSEDLSAMNGGDLGTQAEDQLDPALSEILFATETGSVSTVISSSRGLQILWLREVIEAKETPFDEAAPILAKELLVAQRTPEAVEALAKEIGDEWKSLGSPPIELMLARGLNLGTASQLPLNTTVLPELGSMPELVAEAALAEPGAVMDTLFAVDDDRIVVQLRERSEADMDAFAAEVDTLHRRLLFETRNEFIEEWRNDVVANADVTTYL